MRVPHDSAWFTCSVCHERWPGSRLAGGYDHAGGGPICRDCAELVGGAGVS